MEPTHVRLNIPENIDLLALMGPADSLLRRIERAFGAMITVRGNQIQISGSTQDVTALRAVFARLIAMVGSGDSPEVSDVDVLIAQVKREQLPQEHVSHETILTHRGRSIKAKTAGQAAYVSAMRNNTITFGTGPAGSGKSYLAVACSMAALMAHEVARVVLARPVVEAGESLGFLPGTLEEKLDPYVRPLYDALFDMGDAERISTLIEQGTIEIAPLAFMRGRTFNDAFVILDEAQNTTPEQMKMFLTRLGYASKFVITGDLSQRDILGDNGLSSAKRVLEGIDDIAFVELTNKDIVRHALVGKIVDAYDKAQHPRNSKHLPQGGTHGRA